MRLLIRPSPCPQPRTARPPSEAAKLLAALIWDPPAPALEDAPLDPLHQEEEVMHGSSSLVPWQQEEEQEQYPGQHKEEQEQEQREEGAGDGGSGSGDGGGSVDAADGGGKQRASTYRGERTLSRGIACDGTCLAVY